VARSVDIAENQSAPSSLVEDFEIRSCRTSDRMGAFLHVARQYAVWSGLRYTRELSAGELETEQ
jgi:hypothetical protein